MEFCLNVLFQRLWVNARNSFPPQSLNKLEINIHGKEVSQLEDVGGKEKNGIEKFMKKLKI